jgi:hypothetical protein
MFVMACCPNGPDNLEVRRAYWAEAALPPAGEPRSNAGSEPPDCYY